jgi:hypothetical protein
VPFNRRFLSLLIKIRCLLFFLSLLFLFRFEETIPLCTEQVYQNDCRVYVKRPKAWSYKLQLLHDDILLHMVLACGPLNCLGRTVINYPSFVPFMVTTRTLYLSLWLFLHDVTDTDRSLINLAMLTVNKVVTLCRIHYGLCS